MWFLYLHVPVKKSTVMRIGCPLRLRRTYSHQFQAHVQEVEIDDVVGIIGVHRS